jgi:predicted PurR-regulated permease PerM
MQVEIPKWQAPVFILAVLVLMWLLSPILPPFIAAILIAWLCNPLVQRLERAGRSRNVAVLFVFCLFFFFLTLALLVLIPIMWDQMAALVAGIPQLVEWFKSTAMPWVATKTHKDLAVLMDPTHTIETVKNNMGDLRSIAAFIMGYVSKSGAALIVFISNLLLLPILSFYFLRDWPKLLERLREALPRAIEPKIVQLVIESNNVLGGFLRGQFMVMLSLGLIYAIGLWMVGLSTGLLIGFLAGMVAFVPYLGATFGIIAAVIASLIQYGDVHHLLLVAAVFAIGQTIESFLLTPWLVGDRIGLHPVMVIFAIMAGGQLFGFMGILLALPVASVINVLYKHMHTRYLNSNIYGAKPEAQNAEPVRPDI